MEIANFLNDRRYIVSVLLAWGVLCILAYYINRYNNRREDKEGKYGRRES